MEKQHGWPDPDNLFSPAVRETMDQALSFLASVRCFLHLRSGRDDNMLTWDAQSEAAAQKIGSPDLTFTTATEWMRILFQACPRGGPDLRPIARGNARGAVSVLPPAGNVADRLLRCGFFRRGRIDIFSNAGRSVRSGFIFPHVSADRAARFQAQSGSRASIGTGGARFWRDACPREAQFGIFFRMCCRSCMPGTPCALCTPFIC